MESKAIARYIHQSPFKLRKTLNSVRGLSVEDDLNKLHFSSEKASVVIEKTLRSAIANLLVKDQESKISTDSLKIKSAFVDGGPVMKRFRAASMGRASRLRRPTSHLTIIVTSKG